MNRLFASLLIVVLLLSSPVEAAKKKQPKQPAQPQNYHAVFDEVDKGHIEAAYAATGHMHDDVLNKVIRGYYYSAPGNSASFEQLSSFIRGNPEWPNIKDIRAMAEAKIPAGASPEQVVGWFATYPPVSVAGVYRNVDALVATGRNQEASDLIRSRWISGDFRNDELTAYYNRYHAQFYPEDHRARLDRLLWANDAQGAKRLYGLFTNDMRNLADARLALAGQKFGAAAILARVPQEMQADPGLLYERLRWLRKNNRDEDAIDILDHAPENLGKPEAWWEERQIQVRRAMDKHDYALAYRLATNHNLTTDGTDLLQAEFMAGWLALRFLNEPGDARDHFQILYQHATTPISRARGAYWLGRSLEALDQKSEAVQAYQIAAGLNTTYYGQLALTRLYASPVVSAMPEPAIPSSARTQFFSRDIVRAIEHLHAIGEATRARTFFRAALNSFTQRSEFVLMSELAYQIKRPDLAIEAAKAANQKNIVLAAGGFPVLDHRMPSPPEPAFTYALIRQESMFNPDALSPAGAHGLMQLMPATAKSMAQKTGVRFKTTRLDEPDYNLKLGTAFIQNVLNSFSGSYVLALAGYNAGPSRVRDWMEQIGDPRDGRVDPVDWVELIPVPETRNYVQRIMENLQVYRARLNGGHAQLQILKDLRR